MVQLRHFDHGDAFLDVGAAIGRRGDGSHSSALVHKRLVVGRLVLLGAAEEAKESHGRDSRFRLNDRLDVEKARDANL